MFVPRLALPCAVGTRWQHPPNALDLDVTGGRLALRRRCLKRLSKDPGPAPKRLRTNCLPWQADHSGILEKLNEIDGAHAWPV